MVSLFTHIRSLRFQLFPATTAGGFKVNEEGVRLRFFCGIKSKQRGAKCEHITPIEDFSDFLKKVNLPDLYAELGDLIKSRTQATRATSLN